MRTRRLISTITYNSLAGLENIFERLLLGNLIDWAHYIWHEPDCDEEKGHWHVVLQPATTLDTNALRRMFDEVPWGTTKAVGCIPFRNSVLDDWLLYAIHDALYLASKGQTRKHHYARSDVRSTSPELLREQWKEINLSKYGLGQALAEAAAKRVPWERLITTGLIPANAWTFWREVYYSLLSSEETEPPYGEAPPRPPQPPCASGGGGDPHRWGR